MKTDRQEIHSEVMLRLSEAGIGVLETYLSRIKTIQNSHYNEKYGNKIREVLKDKINSYYLNFPIKIDDTVFSVAIPVSSQPYILMQHEDSTEPIKINRETGFADLTEDEWVNIQDAVEEILHKVDLENFPTIKRLGKSVRY